MFLLAFFDWEWAPEGLDAEISSDSESRMTGDEESGTGDLPRRRHLALDCSPS